MTLDLFGSRFNIIIISLGAALFISVILQYTWIAAAVILFIFTAYLIGRDFILAMIILAYLVVTGESAESLRTILNITALLALLILFFNKYGFELRKYPRVPVELTRFIPFLFFTLFVSSVFSRQPVNGLMSMIRLAVFLLICYIFYSLLENRKTIHTYLAGLFLTVLVLGGSIFISLFQSGFSFLELAGSLARFAGFYENPNYAGLLLVVSVPVLVSLYFVDKFKTRNKRILITLFLALCFAILMLADSRASLLAIAISLAFIFAMLNRRLFFRILISVAAVSGILLLIPQVQDFLDLYLRLDRLGNRDYFWNTGLDIIKAYPVFGVGPDMFQNYFFTYMPSAVNNFYSAGLWVVGKPHPHNFFLYFIAENGVLGLISAVYFWVLFFYFGFKTIRLVKKISNEYFIICVAVTGIGLGMFVRSFFEITGYLAYGFITRDLPFWIMYLILIKIYSQFKSEELSGLEPGNYDGVRKSDPS